jgi:hypothetical protein
MVCATAGAVIAIAAVNNKVRNMQISCRLADGKDTRSIYLNNPDDIMAQITPMFLNGR